MHEFHRAFLSEVEQFIADRKTNPTAFGKAAVGDPRFVFQLREGREPRLGTVAKVKEYMAAQVGEEAA